MSLYKDIVGAIKRNKTNLFIHPTVLFVFANPFECYFQWRPFAIAGSPKPNLEPFLSQVITNSTYQNYAYVLVSCSARFSCQTKIPSKYMSLRRGTKALTPQCRSAPPSEVNIAAVQSEDSKEIQLLPRQNKKNASLPTAAINMKCAPGNTDCSALNKLIPSGIKKST